MAVESRVDRADPDGPDYADPGIWDRLGAALRGPRAPVPRPGHGQVRCEPGWFWQYRLADFDLWCVLGGRGLAVLNGRKVALSAGCLLALRPGDEIRAEQDPDARLMVSYLHYGYGAGDPSAGPAGLLPPRTVRLDDLAPVWRLLGEVHQLLRRGGPDTPVRVSATLTVLLLEVHAQAARAAGALPAPLDPRIAPLVERLRRQPGERLDLAEAAARARMSPAAFSRLFRAQTGVSFREFRVRVRLERAGELLRQGNHTVERVARMLGYPDHRLFVRQFRARLGVPPGQWRRLSTPQSRLAP